MSCYNTEQKEETDEMFENILLQNTKYFIKENTNQRKYWEYLSQYKL